MLFLALFFRKQLNITTQLVSPFFTYLQFIYKETHIYLSICMYVCLSVRPSVHQAGLLAGLVAK